MAKKRKQLDQSKNKIILGASAIAPLIFPLIFISLWDEVGSGAKIFMVLVYLISHCLLLYAALSRFKSCPDCRIRFTKIEDGLNDDYYLRCDKCGKEWDAS